MNDPSSNQIAALFSHHIDPKARLLPRFQMNNPMNAAGLAPTMQMRSTPYGDAAVPMQTPGMIPSPQPQQRIVLNRPNLAGLPALQLSPQSAGILADSPRPGMLPMGGTAQVQAMGVDTSAGGQMRQKRSARRPK
jgi:hypothetical protein